MGNIIVGVLFAAIVLWAFKRVRHDAKNKTCACSGACTDKSKCGKVKVTQLK